jgi:hypothetical protein
MIAAEVPLLRKNSAAKENENEKVEDCYPRGGDWIDCGLVRIPPVSAGGAAPQPVETGTFHSVFHPTEGTATIYHERDGSRLLRLTSFKTSNGPDVHIYMVAAADAVDSPSVLQAGYIDLGLMKGNIGDQNYALGPDVDLTKYRSVSVWCKRFSYNFGTAPLNSEHLVTQK